MNKSFEEQQKEKILKSYNGTDNMLEKGGEGSRGGKVIGHTKSGLPIYESHYSLNSKDSAGTRIVGQTRSGKDIHMSSDPRVRFSSDKHFGDFSKQDHQDAVDLHTFWYGKHLKDEGERGVDSEVSKKHIKLAHKHNQAIDYHQDKVDTFR